MLDPVPAQQAPAAWVQAVWTRDMAGWSLSDSAQVWGCEARQGRGRCLQSSRALQAIDARMAFHTKAGPGEDCLGVPGSQRRDGIQCPVTDRSQQLRYLAKEVSC